MRADKEDNNVKTRRRVTLEEYMLTIRKGVLVEMS
jgi:hypothetical protein